MILETIFSFALRWIYWLFIQTIAQLTPHFNALKASFDLLAETVEGQSILRLTNASHGGLARLLEEFDVIPSYLSKKEAKMSFFVILSAQVSHPTVFS